MTLHQLLDKFKEQSASLAEQGKSFERLVHNYLLSSPQYMTLVRRVWGWDDFFAKTDFGSGHDVGIDLVVETVHGEYWAVQCKFYTEDTRVDKKDVDGFLATSARSFTGQDGITQLNFSRRYLFVTNGNFTAHAREAFNNTTPPGNIVSASDMAEDPLDWEKLAAGKYGRQVVLPGKKPRQHQKDALAKTLEHFQTNDRGQLIMACGTGKTYTALQIAEQVVSPGGAVLFMVPSIALLGQSLREWSNDAKRPIKAVCICSDAKVVDAANKKARKLGDGDDPDSMMVSELAFPASTNRLQVVQQFRRQLGLEKYSMTWLAEPETAYHAGDGDKATPAEPMLVVFSTYQSIQVVADAQAELLAQGVEEALFDLIICDEAHRTTGVTLSGEDDSAFVKVHDNEFLKGKKRLYMTATPRIYGEDSRRTAKDADAVLTSMDDPAVFGTEIYRIGFGDAVQLGLLTDYKVLVLTISENDVPKELQRSLSDEAGILKTDDATALIGCINALSKQVIGNAQEAFKEDSGRPMRRAVAFTRSIKVSQQTTDMLNRNADKYRATLAPERQKSLVKMNVRHIDGGMGAVQRNGLLEWLKAEPEHELECRMLTNVRCLSEGVDVPSLDAVLFLSPRSSQVDVVQSVGRVMRRAAGKAYGYIIIPVFVPAEADPAQVLDKGTTFKVVWEVLNALRAHDDRFNATINKIELNKNRPSQITVGAVPDHITGAEAAGLLNNAGANAYDPGGRHREGKTTLVGGEQRHDDAAAVDARTARMAQQLSLGFGKLQDAIYAKMVTKVGERRYWETWAKDIADIARIQLAFISQSVQDEVVRPAFLEFVKGLQQNINPAIREDEAVEMLAQHRITQPVFEALFEDYSFAKNNPISVAMDQMLAQLQEKGTVADLEKLQGFYTSVRKRAEGIDNAEGKQRIIIELYDKFFRAAFPTMAERLGIVYTPVEVVDFIIHSVDALLRQEFDTSLAGENVHVLDPFTGTGTFITRLIQSGLLTPNELVRKYKHELHANELVLLAYYIAAVNIENAFHDAVQAEDYLPFEGICLTDTFQLGERGANDVLFHELFPKNSERVERQQKAPLKVIMGNPPYSVGQNSANDNAQNQKYERLESRIANTYAKLTEAVNKNSLYDSYIKAFRWSSDRLGPEGGIVAFVSNGGWLDSSSANGFRRCLEQEFNSIYVFNLRGNARTSGELRRKEGGNVFGEGTRTPVTITLLVKKEEQTGKATIHYAELGDYTNRQEKLDNVSTNRSILGSGLKWETLSPDEKGDWLNQTDSEFDSWIPMSPYEKFDIKQKSIFITYSNGIKTARDKWLYAYSKSKLTNTVGHKVDFFNQESDRLSKIPTLLSQEAITYNESLFSWARQQIKDVLRGKKYTDNPNSYRIGAYRPFNKQYVYFDKDLNDMIYQIPKLFPTPESENLVICTSGIGGTKQRSVFITNHVPDLNLMDAGTQCFPLYYYEEHSSSSQASLFGGGAGSGGYERKSAIAPFILEECRKRYGRSVTPEQVFYFVYGFLHDPHYRQRYENDLKKSLPRIPLPEAWERFAEISDLGLKLANLHLNYEKQPKPEGVELKQTTVVNANGKQETHFRVTKMRYKSKTDKSVIDYNECITITNIPDAVYDYVVNGKSAVDWVMERYQVHQHKESGIINDANDWATEVGNERYILDLLLSVMGVSVETGRLVGAVYGEEAGTAP